MSNVASRMIALWAVALAGATTLAAQSPDRARITVEQQTRERWMHGRQQPRFSGFSARSYWFSLVALGGAADTRRLDVNLGNLPNGRDSAIVNIDRVGRVTSFAFGFVPYKAAMPGDSIELEMQRRLSRVVMEFGMRELIPASMPRAALHNGATWFDTIAAQTIDPPFYRSLRGTRRSRVVGESIEDGRRLWVVRDSADVTYEERYPETERTLPATAEVSRVARGTIVGTYVYDPERQFFRWRSDTTRLVGEAVLRYPDGRAFRTPARFERTRRFDARDPTEHAARSAQLRAADPGHGYRISFGPSNELERRLYDGDVKARDSIAELWRRASAPEERSRLIELLGWLGRGPAGGAFVDSLRIAGGDTAHLYQTLMSRIGGPDKPIDTTVVRAALMFIRDPSIAWSFNLSRDGLYETLEHALAMRSRAFFVGRDTVLAAFSREACELIAAESRSAREPRFADIGLLARLSLDPRRWADTVAIAGRVRPLLRRAALAADGIGATWPTASRIAMPAPNSDWHAWVEWMHGGVPPLPGADGGVRFEGTHRNAIRLHAARTGRDIIGDLRRGYAAADSDSAWYVFATMLRALEELSFSDTELAAALASGVRGRVAFARQAVATNIFWSGRLMPDVEAAPLVDRVIASVIDGASVWRSDPPAPSIVIPLGQQVPLDRVYLFGDSLPQAIRAKWSPRLALASRREWERDDPREAAALIRVGPVRFAGRFAKVELSVGRRLARNGGESPSESASGATYYLMRLSDGEWVVIEQSRWGI